MATWAMFILLNNTERMRERTGGMRLHSGEGVGGGMVEPEQKKGQR